MRKTSLVGGRTRNVTPTEEPAWPIELCMWVLNSDSGGRKISMFAKTLWILLAMALFVVPVRAEQIKIAYSGVSASGTPLWLAKEEGIFTKHGLELN
jgi:hypothetical protein